MTKEYLAIGNEVKACCEVEEIYEINKPLYSMPHIALHKIVKEDFERNLINIKNNGLSIYQKDVHELRAQGYTDQPYAIKFKQFEEVDKKMHELSMIKTDGYIPVISVTQQQYDNIKNGGYLFMRKLPTVWR